MSRACYGTLDMSNSLPLLLTGASGVIGTELLACMPAERLLLSRYRTPIDSPAQQISLNIREARLGLDDAAYQALAGGISGILHCAAITDMNGVADGLHETNIDGVRHMIALAEAADVPLHYVSTAYCSKTYGPKQPAASAYVASKRAAEQLVRASKVRWTISRPSIVVGRSDTGAIANFQGFHLFITSILKGRLPFFPLDPEAHCDFVPADYVASALAGIVAAPTFSETYWLTGGARAITIRQMMEYGAPFAAELGRDLSDIPMSDPESFRRDQLPALQARLPRRLMERINVLLELSSVMATERPFPSDMARLVPDAAPLDTQTLQKTLGHNLHFWGKANRHVFQTAP